MAVPTSQARQLCSRAHQYLATGWSEGMRATVRSGTLLVTLWILVISQVAAQGTAPSPPLAGLSEAIYVDDFRVAAPQDESSGRLLSHIRESRQAAKIAKNAASLTAAVIREFKARGVTVSRWDGQSAAPASGWLIRGVFSEHPPQGVGSSLTSLGSSAPNTEVSVTITDLAAHAPVATSNTTEALKGQGSSAAWNPYAVAARFVVNQMESNSSIDDLSRKIVAQVLAKRVETHKTPTQ